MQKWRAPFCFWTKKLVIPTQCGWVRFCPCRAFDQSLSSRTFSLWARSEKCWIGMLVICLTCTSISCCTNLIYSKMSIPHLLERREHENVCCDMWRMHLVQPGILSNLVPNSHSICPLLSIDQLALHTASAIVHRAIGPIVFLFVALSLVL